jgi:hypothetical protein
VDQISHHHGEFVFYPNNKVIAIINSADDAHAAVEALHSEGYTDQKLEVLVGHEAAQMFDVDGSKHGLLAKIARRLQNISDLEMPTMKRHIEELEAGHYFVAVDVGDNQEEVQNVRQMLKAHNAHFINYYSPTGVQVLDS